MVGLSRLERAMFEIQGYDDLAGMLGPNLWLYKQRISRKIPDMLVDLIIILKGYDASEGIKNDFPEIQDLIEVSCLLYLKELRDECNRIIAKVEARR